MESYPSFIEKFEYIFISAHEDVYKQNYGKYSEFYSESERCYESHPLFGAILDIHSLFLDKYCIQKIEIIDIIKTLDSAMAMFIFGYWSFNSDEENFNNLRIIFLFRELVNFTGWEHLKLLAAYKIVDESLIRNGEYSSLMLLENLPELIEDFLGIFLKEKSNSLGPNLSLAKNFIIEFCNFLYYEKFINYILESQD